MTQLTKLITAITALYVFANPLQAQENASSKLGVSAASLYTASTPIHPRDIVGEGAFYEPAHIINFDVYEQNKVVFCNFRTEFNCHSYAIEAKQGPFDEYQSLYYCHNDLCVNTKERVYISFANTEIPQRYFRIKTVLANGDIHYSQTRIIEVKESNEIEILDPVVNTQLNLKLSYSGKLPDYSYTIASVNGDIIRKADGLTDNAINLDILPAGFYFISFNSVYGKTYHYKFFKAANL